MKYLPFEDFEIHTTLTSDQVFYKLRAAVDTQRKWLIFTNKPFWGGEVERHYFRIWRATWGNRSKSVVTGRIYSEGSGSYIQVKMRFTWFGFLSWVIFLGVLWFMYFGSIAHLITQKIQTGIWEIESTWMLLPGIGMFAFAYLISIGNFKYDTHYIKEYFLWLAEINKENIVYKDKVLGLTESQIIKSLLVVTGVASLGWIVYSLIW